MHTIAIWFIALLVTGLLGYAGGQALKARRELARVLGSEEAVTALFGAAGLALVKAGRRDQRIARALKDRTLLAISTPIIYRAMERGYQQLILTMTVMTLAIIALCASFVHPGLAAISLAAALAGSAFPLHAYGQQRVRRDLGVLAYSLKIWYETDPIIFEDITSLSLLFTPLFSYVKAHYIEKNVLH